MSRDAFSMLGLPRRFDLSANEILGAHRTLAAQVHPDRLGSGADAEAGLQQSAALNEARSALLNPERRANELLAVLGGPSKEADRSLPDGFLLEMMAVRQEMEEALGSGDPAERARLEQWALAKRDEYAGRVAGLFADAAADATRLGEIRRELNAWRYIERMIEQLDPDHNGLRL